MEGRCKEGRKREGREKKERSNGEGKGESPLIHNSGIWIYHCLLDERRTNRRVAAIVSGSPCLAVRKLSMQACVLDLSLRPPADPETRRNIRNIRIPTRSGGPLVARLS